MSESDSQAFTAVLAVVGGIAALVVVGLLVLRPGTTETHDFPDVTISDPGDTQPSGAPAAVVTGKRKSGGTSILGVHFGRETFRVSVQFYVSSACLPLIDFGEVWPAVFPECSSDVAVEGEVSGLGRAPTGETLVVVDIDVGSECFDGVSGGVWWPPDVPACGGAEGAQPPATG